MREAQPYLTQRLRERDPGVFARIRIKIILNEYLDRWFATAVIPRVAEKTCQDYNRRPHSCEFRG